MPSVSEHKLEKRLRHQIGKAIMDYKMIEHQDKIMVCLSGGKDSYTLLDFLLKFQKKVPISFEIEAVNLDQKQPGFPEHILPNYLESVGVRYKVLEQDTYSVVKRVIPEGKNTCSLCSRMRRGALYEYARENSFTKIALGHHKNDIVETLFMNLFFGGTLKAMPPKLKSDDGENLIIRPLSYCNEQDIIQYANNKQFPVIPCNLCGSQDNLQRKEIKKMLLGWEKQFPGRLDNIFRALTQVKPSQLADFSLFDFKSLQIDKLFSGTDSEKESEINWLE